MILENPDNTETHYEVWGARASEPLLLLHGLGADHAMWQPQIRKYVDAGYRLFVPDLFGHGQSSKLPHLDLSDWHHQINWLLNSEQVKQCTLIGVSMGGVIAQSFAVRYPERIGRMVLADSFGELKTLQEKVSGLLPVIGFYGFKLLGQQRLATGIQAVYAAEHARNAQNYFGQICRDIDLDQMIQARKAINRINVLEALHDIDIPTLVLVGSDFGSAFIESNRKIADALLNAEFVILEKAMDPSNLVNPAAFDRHVLRFLAQAY